MKKLEAIAAIEKLVSDKRLNAQSNTYQSVMLAIEHPNRAIPCSGKITNEKIPPISWVIGVEAVRHMTGLPFEIVKDKTGRDFVKISL